MPYATLLMQHATSLRLFAILLMPLAIILMRETGAICHIFYYHFASIFTQIAEVILWSLTNPKHKV